MGGSILLAKSGSKLMAIDTYSCLAITRAFEEGLGGRIDRKRVNWTIYYWMTKDEHIYMLFVYPKFVYPKNEQEDLTPEQKKTLKLIVKWWSDEK